VEGTLQDLEASSPASVDARIAGIKHVPLRTHDQHNLTISGLSATCMALARMQDTHAVRRLQEQTATLFTQETSEAVDLQGRCYFRCELECETGVSRRSGIQARAAEKLTGTGVAGQQGG
jgi:hypothetical protein